MDQSALLLREKLLARHDEAVARWPDWEGPAFAAEMTGVVDGLQRLATDLDRAGADPVERSRTWRFAGDALFDLAGHRRRDVLMRAAVAFSSADRALNGVDAPLERAKLDFNHANTLRALSGGTDQALLEEVELRYRLALSAFRELRSPHASTVERALGPLKTQLRLLAIYQRAAGIHDELRAASDGLESRPEDPDARGAARLVLDRAMASRAPIVTAAVGQVRDALSALPPGSAESLASQAQRLQGLCGASAKPILRMLGVLMARVTSAAAAGQMSADRATALSGLLADLDRVVVSPDDTPLMVASRLERMRELMRRLAPLLADPSTGAPLPTEGSRAAVVDAYQHRLSQFFADELATPGQGDAERKTRLDLFEQLASARVGQGAATAGSATDMRPYEHDVLRPLAARVDAYTRRRHLAAVQPFWDSPSEAMDPSAVVATGSEEVLPLLRQVLRERRLTLVKPRPGVDLGQAKWVALSASRLLVCDLRVGADPIAMAAACYDLGLARTLGCAVVIVIGSGQTLPFDIDVEVLALKGEGPGADALSLGHAIDEALLTPPPFAGGSSVAETVDALCLRHGESRQMEVRHCLGLLRQAADDPIEVRRQAGLLLGLAGDRALRLTLPAWPLRYPVPGARRLFHVMPFRPAWADGAREVVAQACREGGAGYVRGDEPTDPRIVRSIWDEIGLATHVLVDLTGFNANVALELGFAHGLGRPCLLVGQGPTVSDLFPAIRKLRLKTYRSSDGAIALGAAVRSFIS